MPILPFINNPKDLDPSYKTDLDLWDCFGRKKLCLITEEIWYFIRNHIVEIRNHVVDKDAVNDITCTGQSVITRGHKFL